MACKFVKYHSIYWAFNLKNVSVFNKISIFPFTDVYTYFKMKKAKYVYQFLSFLKKLYIKLSVHKWVNPSTDKTLSKIINIPNFAG